MAIKKSELYSRLWASCDALRGGMDASQYKDYVLVMLFIKYISDKYAHKPFAPIQVPEGASFADMVALKGTPNIGDDINKLIIGPLEKENRISIKADFNDSALLGDAKEKVDRLSRLIAIFQDPALDFSRNRADGDDILGDAYEYLMRHFATESGKSKGQFYTPAEVSRVMAAVLGIGSANTSNLTTVYDPTCGSGSLLLKVADEAHADVNLFGQEKDEATSGLARMNMILHNKPGAVIEHGNTLTNPRFRSGEALKTFDYVVANPPFSDKQWSTGLDPQHDPFERFKVLGAPPEKQGDYAYLLHIIKSLKSNGRGACILPHGVLFRGNAEADIRRNLVRRGYIKGIIGLPANLFYGTGIPACIVVIDKAGADTRQGIFMVDASRGFMKDGPKNRLRSRDIHKIVDVFTRQDDTDPSYAKFVPLEAIERNDYNLNLPRYLDSPREEDRQDIEGHLKGGIPATDVAALHDTWAVCPGLEAALFRPKRPGYVDLAVDTAAIKTTIFEHPEFRAFVTHTEARFADWRARTEGRLKALAAGFAPKALIHALSEDLLQTFTGQPLLDPYAIYQQLMDLWAETMQDQAYLVAAEGWRADTYRVIEIKKGKNGQADKPIDKGWVCDLVPKAVLVARHFTAEQAELDRLAAELDTATARRTELEDEHGGEDAAFAGFDKITAASLKDRIQEIGTPATDDTATRDELAVLTQWLELNAEESALKKRIKAADAALDAAACAHYPTLTADQVKTLVVDDQWLAALDRALHSEMDRISQALARRVRELADRYATPLPSLAEQVEALEARVNVHLAKMGFAWK